MRQGLSGVTPLSLSVELVLDCLLGARELLPRLLQVAAELLVLASFLVVEAPVRG
jgi:hypothetical protein